IITGDPQITLGLTTAATGTINDPAPGLPTSAVARKSVVKGDMALTFTGTQSAARTAATTINYSFSGTATPGIDFTNTTTSVTIPAGATTATITVPTLIDNLVEPSETVIVTLGIITGDPQITLGLPTAATGTINDPAPGLPTSA